MNITGIRHIQYLKDDQRWIDGYNNKVPTVIPKFGDILEFETDRRFLPNNLRDVLSSYNNAGATLHVMGTCLLNISQVLDLDTPEYAETIVNSEEANFIANQEKYGYFLFNNCLFMSMYPRHYSHEKAKTVFGRDDLIK